jgi:hypothetical protein
VSEKMEAEKREAGKIESPSRSAMHSFLEKRNS